MTKTTAPLCIVVATTTFHAPAGLLVIEGTLYDGEHPVVKAHPTQFTPVEVVAIQARREGHSGQLADRGNEGPATPRSRCGSDGTRAYVPSPPKGWAPVHGIRVGSKRTLFAGDPVPVAIESSRLR